MLIYKDAFNGDELCSDSYPSKMLHDGAIMEVDGAYIMEGGGIDDSLIGGNASADGADADAGADDAVAKVINVISTHKLSQTSFTKKDFKTCMKGLLKKTVEHLNKNGKESEVANFKKGAQAAMMAILENFKDWDFYTGESMDPEATLVLGGYREDGITPFFWYFAHTLEEEKF